MIPGDLGTGDSTRHLPSRSRFPGERYLSLETYKKSGKGVRTTVWFVEANGRCYIRTHSNSGKAKRMRANPRVKVSPSTFSGHAKGEWIDAHSTLSPSEETAMAARLFGRRYNVQKWATDVFSWLMRRKYVSFSLDFGAQDQ